MKNIASTASPALAPDPQRYIPALDGLRAVAILLVIANHLGLNLVYPGNGWVLADGMAGVRLFFALSGFLITSLMLEEIRETGRLNLVSFWIRRSLRILPPFFLMLAACAALTSLGYLQIRSGAFLYSAFFLYDFVPPGFRFTQLIHTWSLALEEQFYLVWPAVMFFFRSRARALALGFVTLCVLMRFALASNLFQFDITTLYLARCWFIPAGDAIAFGCLFALVPSFRTLLNRYPDAWRLAGVALWTSPVWLAVLGQGVLEPLGISLQGLAAAMLVLWVAEKNASDDSLTRFLSLAVPVSIGKISYSLYLWQGVFLGTGPGMGQWLFQKPPLNLVLTVACALISYRCVEVPLKRMRSAMNAKAPETIPFVDCQEERAFRFLKKAWSLPL